MDVLFLEWIYSWQFWLVLALLLFLIEVQLIGSYFIFLPMALASLLLMIIYASPAIAFMKEQGLDFDWKWAVGCFSAVSLLLSVVIQKLLARNTADSDDVNLY